MIKPLKSYNRLSRILVYVAAFFAGIILLLLLFKGTIFSGILNNKIRAYNETHRLQIHLEEAHLRGFSRLTFQGVQVSNPSGDTMLYVASMEISIRPFNLISRKHLIKSFQLDSGFIAYSRYPKLVDTSHHQDADTLSGNNLPERLIDLTQRYFPSGIVVNDFQIRYLDSLGMLNLELQNLEGNAASLAGTVKISDNKRQQEWHIKGQLGDKITVEARPETPSPIPGIYQRLHLDLRMDTLHFAIENKGQQKNKYLLDISGRIAGLKAYHPKISSDTVAVDAMQANMHVLLGNAYLEIDSNSRFQLNQVNGRFGLLAPLTRKGNQFALLIESDQSDAQTFFNSLPKGAFDDAQGIKAEGKLQYRLEFRLDGNHPDDVIFESSLYRDKFKIVSYGNTNLALMNGEFSHTVYENEKPFRTFIVGPENPNFVPLALVPKNLINAILVSEDPSFFQHRGFIQEAFRESIAVNYKTKSFKRGGSTISMQLVKNVFLNRKKTVFRKMEEALLVWLIESQHLTSKERMMEVYVNIIEWGPGIYGIGEASQFYFQKSPMELSLPECIYLANIIPKPKKFKYSFTQEGQLRDYMSDLQRFILKRMVIKEMLPPSDTLNYSTAIHLSGPARNLVVVNDTIPLDTFSVEEEPLLFEIVPE